jgi:hypothetical protein
MLRFSKLTHLIVLSCLAVSSPMARFADSFRSQTRRADSGRISLSTQDRLQDMPWWPTKGVASRGEYVGTEECAKCHSSVATSQISTEMAEASSRSADSAFLDGHGALAFQQAPYSYEIDRKGDAIRYSVGDGHSFLSQPLLFAFGQGIVGHTYIYQVGENFFESRLSYYSALKALDLTTGHLHSVPPDLERALGRLLDPREAQKCFGCHTTASTTANHFDPSKSLPGVTCEACHGPGSRHVRAMETGQIEEGKKMILNPSRLDPVSSVDFCGACHRTSGDVLQMGIRGVATVRFQPFRLEESRCWSRTSRQLTCVACHDPHEPLVHESGSYDHICLHCHAQSSNRNLGSNRRITACRISNKDCASCHMPKIELPGMHHAFTDHRIRIVRDAASYPD